MLQTFPSGRTVIVTGAGSGIGLATALLAARCGLRVAVWDLTGTPEAVRAIESEGGAAVGITADVSDPDAVRAALAETGPAAYLVNNAGPSSANPIDFDRAMTLTVGSVRLVTEAWLETGPPEGAAVVNIASVAGNFVGTDSPWYSAGKAAIAGYTRYLATRMAHPNSKGVRANAIAPGFIATPRMTGFEQTPLGRDLIARNPMGRAGAPEDVAGAILFLLSPFAAYINGVLLPVDGGWMVTQ